MKNSVQQKIQYICFKQSIIREELLIKKYDNYYKQVNNIHIRDMFAEFKKTSEEHIKMFKDKMELLNPQGELKL